MNHSQQYYVAYNTFICCHVQHLVMTSHWLLKKFSNFLLCHSSLLVHLIFLKRGQLLHYSLICCLYLYWSCHLSAFQCPGHYSREGLPGKCLSLLVTSASQIRNASLFPLLFFAGSVTPVLCCCLPCSRGTATVVCRRIVLLLFLSCPIIVISITITSF